MISILSASDPELAERLEVMAQERTLANLIWRGLQVSRLIAVKLIEEIIGKRADEAPESSQCARCGASLESKGRLPRQLVTIIGVVRWRRQVRRCPKGCKESQVAPLDEALGITPNQRTGPHLKRMACALAVFVPFEIAATLLLILTGVAVSPSSIWNWVQEAGARAMVRLQAELDAVAEGHDPELEAMSDVCQKLAMLIGADGVMVPFRPQERTPKGKTVWREVKVGIVARWQKYTTAGKQSGRLVQRRVTACLGTVDDFQPRLWLLACQQGLQHAPMVVWLSDGGRGFWRIFYHLFQPYAIGILDFYHAAQNLWKGITPWLDGRSRRAHTWFQSARRSLKNGHAALVLTQIHDTLQQPDLSDAARNSLQSLYNYLAKHLDHTHFAHYQRLGIPIGSGFVESACKWLIQQRFKGVGMRWSEDGFNHLLHLRLAWVNGSFPDLFDLPPI